MRNTDALEDDEPEDEVSLEVLYGNLFDPMTTSGETFNRIVETSMQILSDIVQNNYTKEQLDTYLQRQLQAKDEHKRAIGQFWKSEQGNIIRAL